ncbi:ATP-binding cassette sub-family A member 8 [Eumeta japonica]|uniref:ATP-binding cassette sub-family A member 8 n=1 Tax=Eumeta variegata TaxID=151549 RepID=A0A4C1XNV8_EUMVA|nr:ATP-binding cassette sub-family A member 8 [Eumeta japonica]
MDNFGAFSLGGNNQESPYGKVLAYYNSTYAHSLPIIFNMLDNSIYRVAMAASGILDSYKSIEVWTHPFQQTEQPEEFNLGNVVCAIFMGMIFALVPVTLAVDIVYDRERGNIGSGSDIAFYLHLVFSFLDVMYIPYAIIYYVDRVYMTCNLHGHCTEPTLSSYFTAEIWVLLAAMVVHVPLCSAALLAADRLKSGRRICSKTKPPPPSAPDVEAEFSEAGEDEDVRRERRHASALLQNPSETPPALIVHVVLGGQGIDGNPTSAFQMLGYCPQHDALWKNVSVREHIECYAAIRGVSKADTPRCRNSSYWLWAVDRL